MVSAAQARGAESQFDDGEHSAAAHPGGAGHRQRRANGQHALQQIAQINQQLRAPRSRTARRATLEDQRDQDITQLSQLMNVRVVQNSNNQISLFTGNGQQLVAGSQASQLSFNNAGHAVGDGAMERQSEPGRRRHHHAHVAGRQHDRSCRRQAPFSRARSAPICRCATPSCRRRRTQLDEMANQMSQALVEPDDAGTAVTSGRSRASASISAAFSAGNTVQLTYTDAQNIPAHRHRSSRSAPAARCRRSRRIRPIKLIGVDFSGGMGSVVTQLNAALGTQSAIFQPVRHRPAGSQPAARNTVNSLSATSTATSLTSGSAQLPLFTDGYAADHRRDYRRAARRPRASPAASSVNAALVASPASLVAYASNTASGDATRPNFIAQSDDQATLTFPPTTGFGSATAPYSGTLSQYMSQVVSQQSQAATAATNLQQGQDTVVTRCNSASTISPASTSTPKCRI